MADRTVEEVKTRIDIVDIVKEYVPLKKAGSNHKGLCPFHNEKTPSFTVSQDKQMWYCFGCGEGGDVFSFIQKIEGSEFPEALRFLAERAGVKLERYDPKTANAKTRLLDCVKAASDFYVASLHKSHEGEIARRYVAQRNIDSVMQDHFKIGYAPDKWDALSTFLKNKNFTDKEIADAGLSVARDGKKPFDRFRKRLMFPLQDHNGTIVGFTGRVLDKDQPGGKYVNSPQTLLYDKSRIIYGLDKAKNGIRKTGVVILVEGQTDVISAHQAGITNVVATSGTALTEAQVKMLSRFAETFAFCFDSDDAGVGAAKRGIALAQQHDVSVKAVVLPFGKDPDECIRKDKQAFIKAVANAKPVMEYYFDLVLDDIDLTNVDAKKKAAMELLAEIGGLANAVERTHYIDRLADRLAVSRADLHEVLTRVAARRTSRFDRRKPTQETQPAQKADALVAAAEYVLSLMLTKPETISVVAKECDPEVFTETAHRELYKKIVLSYTTSDHFSVSSLLETLNNDIIDLVHKLRLLGDDVIDGKDFVEVQHELHIRLQLLSRAKIKRNLRDIETRIRQLEGDPQTASAEELQRLTKESVRLTNALRHSM